LQARHIGVLGSPWLKAVTYGSWLRLLARSPAPLSSVMRMLRVLAHALNQKLLLFTWAETVNQQ
jgi:hypothetical protein